MNYKLLPKRVFNSPCLQHVNFDNNTFINLIRLIKPYANGMSYAIYNNNDVENCAMVKTLEAAETKFENMIVDAVKKNVITSRGIHKQNY